ncbi:MAG: dihydrolipoyl dehydrogenase [Candidatus Brocadiaceae bacterium]|uniref:dihydrolipoyl dehydrogenase n=1 Tax=Candidatus Wunengus sp. YC61 TaxID=3367698 RepID=UPI00271A03D7|nr:dihydrolipoyl dehydrogenase [Candidatus Brocadiaceae bacterium]
MPERSAAFDLVIIGGGPGGYVSAIKAAQLGIKTALVEKNKVGGTCLHQGCIPTKVLLHSADIYRKLLKAHEYGITFDKLGINYPQFHRRKESVVKRLFQGTQFLLKKNGVEVFEGEGQLTSANNVLIKKNGTDIVELSAKNVILATGSVPLIPRTIPHDAKYVLTSDNILLQEEIPKSIIIAGGGAVGIEFAYLFNILGSKVTIVELLDDVLPAEDKEIRATLRKILTKRGVDILTKTSLEKVEVDNGVRVEIKSKIDTPHSPTTTENKDYLKADYLLLALGRTPALTHLGIEKLSLNFKGKYLQTNEVMETSQKGLYAIGDITGPPLLAHKASNEGLWAVSHIAGKETTPINYQNIPRVTYCSPQVASVGLTQEEAENKGYKIKVGKFPLIANSKAIIDGEYEDGFVKIIADEKYGEILGAHAVGPNVGELMWGISLTTILEGTASELSSNIYPHPTLSEAILEAAHAAVDKPIHL